MEKAKVNYTVGEATRLWLDAYRGTETFFVQCMDALRAQYGERGRGRRPPAPTT